MAIDLFKVVTVAATTAGVVIIMQDKKTPAKKRLQYAGIVAGTGGAVFLGRHIYNNWKRKRDLEQEFCQNVNLSQTAVEIYDAFYNNDWLGVTEDEDAAVRALRKVPKGCIDALALVYSRMYKKNLRQDFRNFLDTEYSQVQDLLNDRRIQDTYYRNGVYYAMP